VEKRNQYTDEELEKAKSMFMEGKPFSQIEKETGVNKSSIKYYSGKGWKAEREAMQSELVEAMTAGKRSDLVEITNYGLTFLKNCLKKMSEEMNVAPTPGLIKTISAVVFEINKIKALDESRPTEIVETINPASQGDLIELLRKDPFLTIEDSYEIKDDDIDDSNDANIDSIS